MLKKDLIIKSTLSLAAFSLAFGIGFTTVSVFGSDSANLNSEKAIAGLDLSLDNLITAGGTDLYAYEMENIIETTTAAPEDTDSQKTDDKKTATDNKTEADKTVDADETKDDSTAEDKAAAKKTAEKKVSEYANIGISIANDYVNVRKKNNTESEIVGKLYKGCAATILKNSKEWVKIKSGNVTGYINKDYLAIGFDAEEIVDTYGKKYATVNTRTLNVREKKSTDCKILTQIPVGETYEVIKEYKDWVKISIDNDLDGYVSKEFVDISVEFEKAVSIQEEKEAIEREQAAKRAEEEQARKLQEQQEAAKKAAASNSSSSSSSSNKTSSSSSSSSNKTSSSSSSSSNKTNSSNSSSSNKTSSNKSDTSNDAPSTSAPSNTGNVTGEQVAAYSQNFIGNKYVYGGTSLTNGTDCSGFTQSIYKSFGITIPRDSRSQSRFGKSISMSELQPGDLIFYTNSSGTVNHVTMYIGGGRVCHASNEIDGIKTSVYNYRTPYCARRIIY